MKDNLDNLDNEQQNPTPSKLEEPENLDEAPKVETPPQQVNLDETPKVETPPQQVNLDETPKVETPPQQANLDETPKVETPPQQANLDETPKEETAAQPASLKTPPTDSTTTPSVHDLDNPDPEYSETKKMEKIAAIVHNREEYRKQLEEEKRLKAEDEAEEKRLKEEFIALIDKETVLQNPSGGYESPEESIKKAEALVDIGNQKNKLRQQMMAISARKKTVTPPTDS